VLASELWRGGGEVETTSRLAGVGHSHASGLPTSSKPCYVLVEGPAEQLVTVSSVDELPSHHHLPHALAVLAVGLLELGEHGRLAGLLDAAHCADRVEQERDLLGDGLDPTRVAAARLRRAVHGDGLDRRGRTHVDVGHGHEEEGPEPPHNSNQSASVHAGTSFGDVLCQAYLNKKTPICQWVLLFVFTVIPSEV